VVKFSASGTVVVAAASADNVIGVSVPMLTASAGDRVDVVHEGIADCVAGAAVTRGDAVMSDTAGKVITAASTNRVVGIALESGALNDVIPVKLGL
jgi:predicted RecA/RadA family phage recombinase